MDSISCTNNQSDIQPGHRRLSDDISTFDELYATIESTANATHSLDDYESGYGHGFGSGHNSCYKFQARKVCLPFTDRQCKTVNDPVCDVEVVEDCHIRTDLQGRSICFNVSDEHCQLVENATDTTVMVNVTVQKCERQFERICSVGFETRIVSTLRRMCANVTEPVCMKSNVRVEDEVCRTVIKEVKYNITDPTTYEYGRYKYDMVAVYTNVTSVETEFLCDRVPRNISLERCQPRTRVECFDAHESFPEAKTGVSCVDVPKQVCKFIQLQVPKQFKQFGYERKCETIVRPMCSQHTMTRAAPTCETKRVNHCEVRSMANCSQTQSEHCYTVYDKVKTYDCAY